MILPVYNVVRIVVLTKINEVRIGVVDVHARRNAHRALLFYRAGVIGRRPLRAFRARAFDRGCIGRPRVRARNR
jgi:hypothetical protein